MLDIVIEKKTKDFDKVDSKGQIVLTHTSRELKSYLQSIKTRYSGKYDKIPHYVIGRDGVIHKLLDDLEYTKYFRKTQINKNSITISLENLGWLLKQPLTDYYINWIGDIYKGKVFERKWRGYYFWQPYTDEQINSLYLLLKDITDKFNIDFNIVGHNTIINGVEKLDGIICRSNFSEKYTDVNPSFDFELFLNKIKNE
jgi:N-acetyl-anhydromuramyl-L-alanine amidase AmpD